MNQSAILNILDKLGALDIAKAQYAKGDEPSKERAVEIIMTKLVFAEDAFPKVYKRVKDNITDYEEQMYHEIKENEERG